MNKLILSVAALAMTAGLAATPTQATARDRYPNLAEMDTDKDGMISKEEYLAAAGRRWDAMMVKMKAMNAADQAKMIKDDKMTKMGIEYYWRQAGGGQ
jgi:hypothetical protein